MYGAPVTAPMQIPQEGPSYFSAVPAELPEIKDATVETIRLAGTLDKRLPPMPSGELANLSFTNYKQIEAQELMNDLRASYTISRRQQAKTRVRARERNRQAQKQAERR